MHTTMSSRRLPCCVAAVLASSAIFLLSGTAGAQNRRGGEETGTTAVPASPAPAQPSAPQPASPASPAQPAAGTNRGDRSGGGTPAGGTATGDTGRRRGTATDGGGQVAGTAVPRDGGRPGHGGGGGVIYVPVGYYPWGYGVGFGGYYGGYYDPTYGYPGYGPPVYGGGYAQSPSNDEGAVRLQVKPREASVYVDGYYTGKVDDFDGKLQKLHLSAGPHRIEIRLTGYEPLTVDVKIDPNQTGTYHGDLQKSRRVESTSRDCRRLRHL